MRRAVAHAESLCVVLSRLRARPGRLAARAWLLGRREEVECFVGQLAGDVRSGRLTDVAAASALDAYLESLHRGLLHHFEQRSPSCCSSSFLATVVAAEPDDSSPTPILDEPRAFARTIADESEEIGTEQLLAGLPARTPA